MPLREEKSLKSPQYHHEHPCRKQQGNVSTFLLGLVFSFVGLSSGEVKVYAGMLCYMARPTCVNDIHIVESLLDYLRLGILYVPRHAASVVLQILYFAFESMNRVVCKSLHSELLSSHNLSERIGGPQVSVAMQCCPLC